MSDRVKTMLIYVSMSNFLSEIIDRRLISTTAIAVLVSLGLSDKSHAQLARSPVHRQCIDSGKFCTGMKASDVLTDRLSKSVGGLSVVYCDFNRPGVGVGRSMILSELIEKGCQSSRYVAQFSNGNRLTSIWIDSGIVVRIDQVGRHALDL